MATTAWRPGTRLILGQGRKFLHLGVSQRLAAAAAAATSPVEKSSLAKLRKSTGYSFSRCKEALEKHNNDLKTAEKWLRSEAQTHGWQKATKLQGRATAQGLISVLASPNNAVMLEMNCETDFVARNKKFQTLVQRVTNAAFTASAKQGDGKSQGQFFKNPVDDKELSVIPMEDGEGRLTKDEIVLAIGDIGENIQGRRGLFMQATEPILLSGYTHPASAEAERQKIVQFGKFGAIVAYKSIKTGKSAKNSSVLAELGRQLCQHVVGMNPQEIGSMEAPPPKIKASPPPPPPAAESETQTAQQNTNPEDLEFQQKSEPEVDETILLNQEFLLDPELTVREFLQQNSIEVVDFVRFECGESLSNQ